MRLPGLLRIDLAIAATLVIVVLLLWNQHALIVVPIAGAAVIGAYDLFRKRILLVTTIACIATVLLCAVRFDAMVTTINAAGLVVLLPLYRLLPIAATRFISLGDLTGTALASALAPFNILLTACAFVFLAMIVSRLARRPLRLPIAGVILTTTAVLLIALNVPVYR